MSERFTVLKRPLITEKTTAMGEAGNRVAFEVSLRANKRQIKEAVERTFNVTVLGVNTSTVKGKPVRLGRHRGRKPDRKKALVTLKEGDRVDFFESV